MACVLTAKAAIFDGEKIVGARFAPIADYAGGEKKVWRATNGMTIMTAVGLPETHKANDFSPILLTVPAVSRSKR